MKLLLFDIDGTLLAAHGSGRAAFDRVMHARWGVADASRGVSYGGKTDHALIDEIFAARLGRAADDAEHAEFIARYVDELAAQLAPSEAGARAFALPGVFAALAALRERDDVVLGIATGNVRRGAELKLRAAGIEPAWFAVGGYGCDARVRAALVGAAIARAGDRVREVVVIGDTVHDLTAAHANGARAIGVATGGVAADVLRAASRPGDVVLDDLTALLDTI